MRTEEQLLGRYLDETFGVFDQVWQDFHAPLTDEETGTVTYVGYGIARIQGLPGARMEELVRFPDGLLGMVLDLDQDDLGVALLGESEHLSAGDRVARTGRVMDVPVGRSLLGRVVDATGAPLDDMPPVAATQRLPIERQAPPILRRAPVSAPLQTGCKVIDALIPIGRGQRELIMGNRQTGKTAIAVDAIINQRDQNVICIYCAVGQRSNAVAKVISDLARYDALRHTVVMVASGEDAPGLQFIAPYAATTIGEYFMEQGDDVLIIYDNLTHHARAYRTLSLLLRRPPGREAYPGDIFFIHSRLLERSTHLIPAAGGGSLTALPVVETNAEDVSAYIPTNLISITDGQIYLSPGLFQKGVLPAVDVGRSVSRVGSKAQVPAFGAVAGPLRLAYNQFEELELFSRFSTRLDEQSRVTLERGRRVRQILQQPQYEPVPVPNQIAALYAVTQGVLDAIPLEQVSAAETALTETLNARHPELCQAMLGSTPLSAENSAALLKVARDATARFIPQADHADG